MSNTSRRATSENIVLTDFASPTQRSVSSTTGVLESMADAAPHAASIRCVSCGQTRPAAGGETGGAPSALEPSGRTAQQHHDALGLEPTSAHAIPVSVQRSAALAALQYQQEVIMTDRARLEDGDYDSSEEAPADLCTHLLQPAIGDPIPKQGFAILKSARSGLYDTSSLIEGTRHAADQHGQPPDSLAPVGSGGNILEEVDDDTGQQQPLHLDTTVAIIAEPNDDREQANEFQVGINGATTGPINATDQRHHSSGACIDDTVAGEEAPILDQRGRPISRVVRAIMASQIHGACGHDPPPPNAAGGLVQGYGHTADQSGQRPVSDTGHPAQAQPAIPEQRSQNDRAHIYSVMLFHASLVVVGGTMSLLTLLELRKGPRTVIAAIAVVLLGCMSEGMQEEEQRALSPALGLLAATAAQLKFGIRM